MKDCYIPDLTERFPEGFSGVDMCAPYDAELAAWESFERSYREQEQKALERFNRQPREIIKQDANGWTLARVTDAFGNKNLLLCTIKEGKIIDVEDMAKDTPSTIEGIPDNIETLSRLYDEILTEKQSR